MTSAFESAQARRTFIGLCVSTFLLFTTGSTLAILSLVMQAAGHGTREISLVLSSPIVPVVVSILAAGKLLRHFDPLRVALAGQLLMLTSFAAFEWTIASTAGAALCRAVFGLGFGIFFASSTFVARDLLSGPRTIYLFGIFGGMVTLPNVVAPGLAEYYLRHFGLNDFFLVLSIPAVCASLVLAAMCRTWRSRPMATTAGDATYREIYRHRDFRSTAFANLFIGVNWGMAFGYCALHLKSHGIPVAAFFSSMTTAFFATRFILMRLLHGRSRLGIVALAFATMGIAYLLLSGAQSFIVAALAGALFGAGYSSVLPILSVQASDLFPAADRPMAMALFNVHFHVGFFAFPMVIAAMAPLRAFDTTLLVLGGLGILVAAIHARAAVRAARLDGRPTPV